MKISYLSTFVLNFKEILLVFLLLAGLNLFAFNHPEAMSKHGKDTVLKNIRVKSTILENLKTGTVQDIPPKPKPSTQPQPIVSHYTKVFRLESGGFAAYCLPDVIQGSEMSASSDALFPFVKKDKKTDDFRIIHSPLTVLPNPASDLITINAYEGNLVYIFNHKGKQVLFAELDQNADLDVSGLACGIYTIKVENKGQFRQVQLIIQR
ncbi:MAG: T9SS type A sorting domain-containing protein [Bacteroidales bacterium]|nr:T9SS type A sorting domain-containing protein [Bacteroidales bacterium]